MDRIAAAPTPVAAPDMPPITVIAVVTTDPAECHTTEHTATPATVPMAAIAVMHVARTTQKIRSSLWLSQDRSGSTCLPLVVTALPPYSSTAPSAMVMAGNDPDTEPRLTEV